ncbi:Checkpoint serine/threonine-protein kinase bub1 [Cytospora mali]|uniref:Checkpoint serine/threonine-protein kinase bub1 n=1 Tax=Cytospora mali TaxID=578113 RepID=A0A194VRD1_CYTMA|nr:Checkpoint serine/threonine-protein kinase bub1 [Valsa mali]
MAASQDLINFDVIEAQKENIQALPSGRSAKKLAEAFSPLSATSRQPLQSVATPTPVDTKNINDCIRAEYESELDNIAECDDPLDVYDRYVRWIFDAYPSAQATPASQLHTVLERATKAFIGAPQYKNDPRYLKLWLQYISFFADSPRETFVFLSRHGIGETLALFYEEYAAWLEGAGRWAQAEEVYNLGIEREARPARRLARKFSEFEQRRVAQPAETGPSSPALPTVRPVLAAKIDPFAATERDPQAHNQADSRVRGQKPKASKSKLQIFSDADAAPEPSAMASRGAGSKGWDSIGSLADRKKENMMEPKPWAGETLKAGGKKNSAPKMAVFRDTSKYQLSNSHITIAPSQYQVTRNPASGKKERVFVDLQAVYPSPEEPGTELSFEEIWAANRGWLNQTWEDDEIVEDNYAEIDENSPPIPADRIDAKLVMHHDVVTLDENGRLPDHHRGSKKKKLMEVNETQIIKTKLDSPSGPKITKKKHRSEPTMTMHTRAATDDIYDIFNAPLKRPSGESEETANDNEYETDSNYTTSEAESTCTSRQITTSEAGDTEEDQAAQDDEMDVRSVSEWSDFSTRRHAPDILEDDEDDRSVLSDLMNIRDADPSVAFTEHTITAPEFGDDDPDEDMITPFYEEDLPPHRVRTSYVPIPPEDYVPVTRPYRDPVEMSNNRLPFMTPITERTESSLKIYSENINRYVTTKTPSKRDGGAWPEDMEESDSEGSLSSPLREVVNEGFSPVKIPLPMLSKSRLALAPKVVKPIPPKGPIVKDTQCNPVDEKVRNEILEKMQPPLSSYPGFYDHRNEKCEKGSEIRRFVKACKSSRTSTDRTANLGAPVVIQLPDIKAEYTLKKELGAGAFAPVYLVENSFPEDADDEEAPVAMGKGGFAVPHNRRNHLEALKMEDPPTPWEFHMMRLSHTRLGPQHRATASLSTALEMHLYKDEGLLLLPFHPHGTLLDVVNLFRAESSGVMDEMLAMFFTIELFRTVEALHSKQILHGDLKADNCLLRLGEGGLNTQWHADGSGGWASRGVTLIDFGRGIDMRAFVPEVQFVADWKTTAQDCAEMREGRPWTWQIDYHGLAGIIHCLLFGKYIETVRCDAGGLSTQAGRRYKIRESLKRYWQTEIWAECFEVLLNPSGCVEQEEGGRMPVLRSMGAVRERMENWLEKNCERGVGLKSMFGRVEAYARSRRV